MADDIILPENLSKEMLLSLFQAAYMDVSLDEDGDLVVKDTYRQFVFLDNDEKRYVQLVSMFRSNPDATLEAKLAYANRVNDEIVFVRASVTDKGGFCFDYYIPIQGGITKSAIVFALRRFASALKTALGRDTENVVA